MKKPFSALIHRFTFFLLLFLLSRNFEIVDGQFYKIIPSQDLIPNKFPLNSSTISIGAFLEFTGLSGNFLFQKSFFNVICLECQKQLINSDPNVLPGTDLELIYYDTTTANTSQASLVALEFSLNSTNIASLGPYSTDLLLPMIKFLQSYDIATYSARQLSSTFSSLATFSNLRTITVSDSYLTTNYLQLMKFFGWTWVGAAFASDDIGQSGRYAFSQSSDMGVYFPCFYIIGTQNVAGLDALANCLRNYTDIQVLLLWGSSTSVYNALRYFYAYTNLTYLTFIINPTAAVSIPFVGAPFPSTFVQGSIFIGENYDENSGFYDCLERFVDDPSSFSPTAQYEYENTFNCTLSNDESVPYCSFNPLDRNTGKLCRCRLDEYKYISKPYTSTPVLYRDILKSYALALNRIKYDCSSLKGNFCDLDSITGDQLLDAVTQNSFIGFSGLIAYGAKPTTNRNNGTLNVYQIIQNSQHVGNDAGYTGPELNATDPVYSIIGFMTPKALTSPNGIYLDQDLFHFKTGGNSVPISIPTPETTDLSSGFWPVFVFSLSILGLVLLVAVFCFIVWKWNKPIIRKAGHLFLIIMLVGLACVFTANLLWSVQVSLFICQFKAILAFIGVTLVCGALFAKSVEYFIIFSNCRRRSYDEAGFDRLSTFLFCVGLVVLNSLLWYLLYLLVGGPILCQSFQSSQDFYYWYLGCLPSDTSAANIYIILWLSLTCAFIFFSIILLAISWDIASVYGLAKCMLFVECTIIVLTATILPLYYVLPQYPNYSLQQFLVRSLSSTFCALFALLFIFSPLVYSYYSKHDENDPIVRNSATSASQYDPLNFDRN